MLFLPLPAAQSASLQHGPIFRAVAVRCVSRGAAGAVSVPMGVVLVLARVLAVVVAAEVMPELVRYHQVREAVGVDQGVSVLAVPGKGVWQEITDGAERQDGATDLYEAGPLSFRWARQNVKDRYTSVKWLGDKIL